METMRARGMGTKEEVEEEDTDYLLHQDDHNEEAKVEEKTQTRQKTDIERRQSTTKPVSKSRQETTSNTAQKEKEEDGTTRVTEKMTAGSHTPTKEVAKQDGRKKKDEKKKRGETTVEQDRVDGGETFGTSPTVHELKKLLGACLAVCFS